MSDYPTVILLITGKRKSGKDYIAESIIERCNYNTCTLVRISEPIKMHYAQKLNLNLRQLLSAGEYKEKYRRDMITWSEGIRANDAGYFCNIACNNAATTKMPIWIVSDVRRKSDIKWFKGKYGEKIQIVRIKADEDVRRSRGFKYTEGVDDAPSECDLDDSEEWDYCFENNNPEDGKKIIVTICKSLRQYI